MSKNKDDQKNQEFENEIRRLNEELVHKDDLIEALKKLALDNGLSEELDSLQIDVSSNEELICKKGIYHLARLFENGTFTKDDATVFDILHKNLRSIRGQAEPKTEKLKKPKSAAEILRIIDGGEKA
jgi:hypothetical protein